VLTHDLGEIGKDPEFWPRIVLDLKGRLFIRARTPEEATKFIAVFSQYFQTAAFKNYSGWVTGPPIGSTPHQVLIVHDRYQVGRVFAKIACAFAFVALGYDAKKLPMFNVIRDYALGRPSADWEQLVREIRLPGTIKQLQDRHVAALTLKDEHLVCVISLFGSLATIDMGEADGAIRDFQPAAAIAQIDGTKTTVISKEEAEELLRLLLTEIDAAASEDELRTEGWANARGSSSARTYH